MRFPVNTAAVFAIALSLPLASFAQEKELMSVDEIIDAGTQWITNNIDPSVIEAGSRWAEENIDEEVLRVFKEPDLKTIREFLHNLNHQFQGNDVIALDKLKPRADITQALLDSHPETGPYAQWLKTRQDYFDAAKELRTIRVPPSISRPNVVPAPVSNPPAAAERKVWKKVLAARPAPKGAAEFATRLKPIFIASHVPAPLVWLAEVESSFEPRTRSPAGAAGLYQLMPATARSLGMSLFPVDQRFIPEKNANAAARYLKTLYDRFHDWPLALAAYNAGETRVASLVKKHKTGTYDEISTHLPAETQMYVPKVNATLLRREGIGLADLQLP